MKTFLCKPNHPPPTLIVCLDDVIYPVSMYRVGACRAGADLLRLMYGIDTYSRFMEIYRPGFEVEAVRAVIEEYLTSCDGKTLLKIAAAMESHNPRISAYEDAQETFPLLQMFGVSLLLVGEGSRIGQRLIAERLRLHTTFRHMAYADPRIGSAGYQNAFFMLEAFSGLDRGNAVVICSNITRVKELASGGWNVVYLRREGMPDVTLCGQGAERILTVVNLYALPEALGLVAWGGELQNK